MEPQPPNHVALNTHEGRVIFKFLPDNESSEGINCMLVLPYVPASFQHCIVIVLSIGTNTNLSVVAEG